MENTSIFRYEIQDFIDAHSLVRNRRPIPPSRMLKILAIVILVLLVVFTGIYLYFNLLFYLSSGFKSGWAFNEFFEYVLTYKDDFLCLSFLFAPALLVFAIEPILRFRLWLMIRNNPYILGEERKLNFSEQGVNLSTSSSDSSFKWDYFERVIDGPKYFILTKTKDNYLIVPKRAFSTVADEERFRELVNSKIGPVQNRI